MKFPGEVNAHANKYLLNLYLKVLKVFIINKSLNNFRKINECTVFSDIN